MAGGADGAADRFDQPHRHVHKAERRQAVDAADEIIEGEEGQVVHHPVDQRQPAIAREVAQVADRAARQDDDVLHARLQQDGAGGGDEHPLRDQRPDPAARERDGDRGGDADGVAEQGRLGEIGEAARRRISPVKMSEWPEKKAEIMPTGKAQTNCGSS